MSDKESNITRHALFTFTMSVLHAELADGIVRKPSNGEIDVEATSDLLALAARAIDTFTRMADAGHSNETRLHAALEDAEDARDAAERDLATALDRIVELEGRLARGYGQ